MNFTITDHAEEELVRRAIPRSLLEQILNAPQQIVPAYGGRRAFQSQIDLGGKRYLLRAIVSDADPPTVLTVYRTSRISSIGGRREGDI